MRIVKRIFDVVVSFSLLIILSPLLLITALLVYLKLGYPIFYKQRRPGEKGKIFEIIKFRSMLDLKDKNGIELDDSKRTPTFGRLLRSTSIDELPELINVLKGDMSLVGPRPLLPEYLPLYSKEQARRHEVKPGITGWAQVSGRNSISWKQKFELDVWYIDNWSFFLDIKILFLTVFKVIKREGINKSETITADRFNGHN